MEFIYEKTHPYIEVTRKRLIEAFGVAGVPPAWSEWEVGDPQAPDHVKSCRSPTILVDGEDVTGLSVDETGPVSSTEGDESGPPPLDRIVSALAAGAKIEKRAGHLRLNTAMLPSVGAALLPKLTCPACWPVYAGLLSSMGVGFIDYTPYLLPLTAFFLAVSVLALAYRAPTRRGYGPFYLGIVAATVVLVGKFGFDADPAMWAGLGGLVSASIWNTWPPRSVLTATKKPACPACVSTNS